MPHRNREKPVVLAFVGRYLPGYKTGGILRTTINTIDHLCDEFSFKVVTRDRDLGEEAPYAGVKTNQWQQVGNADVYYLSPQSISVSKIFRLIEQTQHHVLYLNSFFDPLTIKVLLARKIKKRVFAPVIVVPCGEFGWASLKQKYIKKVIFIMIAKIIGLYHGIIWRASSDNERDDIIKIMGVKPLKIQVAGDLPIKNISIIDKNADLPAASFSDGIKVIFLSRISREKNLDYALNILNNVKTRVYFDIYGPKENPGYWKECCEIMDRLPENITVKYLGRVNADEVLNTFSKYDLFLFPSAGESYGHVIAECLSSGTPVLISTETPWRNLQADELGWDIDLAQEKRFVEIIENLALLTRDERSKMRAVIKERASKSLLDPIVYETNRQLLLRQLTLR